MTAKEEKCDIFKSHKPQEGKGIIWSDALTHCMAYTACSLAVKEGMVHVK